MTADFDDATRAQIEAARPDASTWLAANAGSGKTRVLTDRVARLLLSGVEPQQILCLTYTKAAASEMQNRLFKRLGEWAMLDDDALRRALGQLGVPGMPDSDALKQARTLFALAIEAPGGLKIQTIHSFCASILRRFPMEARVSPQFSEIEERAADLLRAEIVDRMAEDPAEAALVAGVVEYYTGEDFARLTGGIVGMRDAFDALPDRAGLLRLFGQPATLDAQSLRREVFDGGEAALLAELVPALLAGSSMDVKAGDTLGSLGEVDLSVLPVLENVLLTGSGAKAPFTAKIGSFPTKATRAAAAHLMPALEALMQRLEDARDARLALEAVDRTLALHRFADRFLAHYAREKELRGWLDFDDLILKTRALLSDPNVAAWVLYRIDGGIDHILVDEAQDTSPRQWDVIEKLTDEFHSGTGARPDISRTLFVVGDRKQSIYSFQGADPAEFDRKAAVFEERIRGAGLLFQRRSLDYSFRSAAAILRLVDTAFDPDRRPDFDKQTQHRAFKEVLPGRVDLWPLVEKAKDEDETPWTDPVDRLSPRHHTVVLAERIAERIKDLVTGDHYIPQDGPDRTITRRRIRAGDFLILVQRRSPLFSEIIRACKAAGLPIAGADRLKVGAELAVRDIAALLSFLATPDDSLSLATALKSPLFGWTEKQLFALAHHRTEDHLWQALRKQEADHPRTLATLNDLRREVDFLRPYDLIERILSRHHGRQNLLARLGPEAEDGINAMLAQALAYERGDVPSLTGFLEWMQTDELEIKRQIDSASNQIRVMTVHGAKGLEAPIVILPDTGRRDVQIKDDLVAIEGVPVWKTATDDMPRRMQDRMGEMKDAQHAERLRLLYVAMTRAEKWLIVAAAGDLSKEGEDWYRVVNEAMGHENAQAVDEDGTLRFAGGDWDAAEVSETPPPHAETPVLDPVFATPAPPRKDAAATRSPSDLGGPKALPGEAGMDTDAAKAYGTLVHALLETLPPVGEDDDPMPLPPVPEDLLPKAKAEAQALREDPALAHLFATDALAEVAITGTLGTERFHGNIDRLVLSDKEVLAIDFKTNRVVPSTAQDCPEGILRQMAAYAALLAQVYPDRAVRTAILWTATRSLMPLPADILSPALTRAALP
jgi:ATP-dependent helicase/nuclease subunit A